MLLAPTENDSRSAIADWLELHALLSPRRVSSKGDLLNAFDIADDDRGARFSHDEYSGEDLDQGILEEPRLALLDKVFEELEFRSTCLGDSYPFEIDARRLVVRTAFREDAVHAGQVAYTFCLLATALRERAIAGIDELPETKQEMELLFQVCACLAAGGYFGGAVCSFGFPRQEGNAFLPALQAAYRRFGHGDVKAAIEAGHPAATKDGGIDVIAWRDHPDRLPAKLYSLGQCASGKNWKTKPVASEVAQFHGTWFTTHPAVYWIPALYIPFLLHDEIDEPAHESFAVVRTRTVAFHERKFGVIFDRLRIAHHAAAFAQREADHRGEVDGAERVMDVAQWVNRTVQKVLVARSAA
ncbi:MAG: hypothetical protein AB1430_11455 [Pseudomonadota bacterium]|jgi:hypothetical protein